MSRFHNRNFELLEPYEGKLSRTVLRGESSRKGADLLDKEYYDRLRNVTHLVRDARKVQQSILLVGELSDIYVTSYDKMLTDDNFSSQELSAIAAGYNKLLERGMNSLKDLKEIVNPTDYSMTDKERLDRIDQAHGELTHTRDLMVYYTRKNISVSYLRSQRKNDTQRVLDLYGSADEKYW